jgi:hypothetical protein
MDYCEGCNGHLNETDFRWGWCAWCGTRCRGFYGDKYNDNGYRIDGPAYAPYAGPKCGKCSGDHPTKECVW